MQDAEMIAESLVKKMEIQQLPVSPYAIAEKYNILIEPKESDESGVSGFLIQTGNNFGIGYATNIKNEGFIRFTIAHELGHYFLPEHPEKLFSEGNRVHKSYSGFISNNVYEKQADYFAKSLLMPEDLFLAALRESGIGFPAIMFLASKCKTSITATAIRFAQFAEDPVAVIMSSYNRINWCFISRALASVKGLRWPRKDSPLPPNTTTASFNRDQTNVLSDKQVEAWTRLDNWFDDAPPVEMKEDVVGLGNYRKTLTVLFTEDPITVDDDDDNEGKSRQEPEV
jgi:Zn-dependent peptidase ImmA (M78 family)